MAQVATEVPPGGSPAHTILLFQPDVRPETRTNPEASRPGNTAESEAMTSTTTEASHEEEAPMEDTTGPDKAQVAVHTDT